MTADAAIGASDDAVWLGVIGLPVGGGAGSPAGGDRDHANRRQSAAEFPTASGSQPNQRADVQFSNASNAANRYKRAERSSPCTTTYERANAVTLAREAGGAPSRPHRTPRVPPGRGVFCLYSMYSGQYAASAELTMTFTSWSVILFPCDLPQLITAFSL